MRMTTAVDELFGEAERSALRLDGECFALGLATVVADTPDGPALRAAALSPATRRYDLVVDTRSAAWVHGALPELPRPVTLAIDVRRQRRTRAVVPPPREARYADGDVERIEGVQVTTALRTAVDLARFEPEWTAALEGVVLDLLLAARTSTTAAFEHATALRLVTGRERLLGRLAALPGSGPTRTTGSALIGEGQPIETR